MRLRRKWTHEDHLRWRIEENAKAVLSVYGMGKQWELMFGNERRISEIRKDRDELASILENSPIGAK
jgi:hypothetical protein